MTRPVDSLLEMASRPPVTVTRISNDDIRNLVHYWIRDQQLFLLARPLIDEDCFEMATQYEAVFTSLCLTHDRFGTWDCDLLCRHIEEVAPGFPLLNGGMLGDLTQRGPGGYVYNALARGPLSHTERLSATTLQERFIRARTVINPLRRVLHPTQHGINRDPESVRQLLETALEQERRISSQQTPPVRSLAQQWSRHEEQLERFRGRSLVGFETGFRPIDQRLLGLRGVTLLGAGPGVGKTVLALQLAVGVCRRHVFNQAVAVFISLELSADALLTRVKCHLTQTDWSLYTRGREQPDGSFLFTPDLIESQQQAETSMQMQGIGERLFIAERPHLTSHTADSICAIVEHAKRQANVNRALVVIDYLQLLELPEDRKVRSDLDADKARFRILQQVQEKSRGPQNPDGDAVLAISEARKPVGDSRKNQLWGTQLADYMGSSRLGYGADAGLLLHTMTKDELNEHYGFSNDAPETRIQQMRGEGQSPLILRVAKGRDGMTLGDIPIEFQYRRSTIIPLDVRQQAPRPSLPMRRLRTRATTQQESPQS